MAKAWAAPEGFGETPFVFTEGRYDHEATVAAEQDYQDRLKAWILANNGGQRSDIIGETIAFPVADGAAQYMVFKSKPLEVIHMNLGDAWNASAITIRGLRASDIRDDIKRSKAIKAMFASK